MSMYAALVRHLTPTFAAGALRRGKSIEQFLGPAFHGGRRGIRWTTIEPGPDGYTILLHAAEDIGDAGDDDPMTDITEFPPLDPEAYDLWPEIATTADEQDAIEIAQRLTGADPGRWTNFGLAAEEYRDYARLGRLPFPLAHKDIVELAKRLADGGTGEQVSSWWMETVYRQTGCHHLHDMIFSPVDGLSADVIAEHVLACPNIRP
jgi:hypothetical protein